MQNPIESPSFANEIFEVRQMKEGTNLRFRVTPVGFLEETDLIGVDRS